MIWVLAGYLFLFVYRPWEVFPALSVLPIERLYMLGAMCQWAVWPGKNFRLNGVHLALLAFTLVVCVSWLQSSYHADPSIQALVEEYLKILIFSLMLATAIRDEKDLRPLVWALVAAVGFYAGHSLREFLCGRLETRQGFHRMIGVDATSRQSNTFASVLVFSLPFAAVCWSQTRNLFLRLGVLGHFALIAACVGLTGSRGGYLILGAFAVMQACVSKHRKKALAVLVFLGIAVNLAAPDFIINRFMTLFDSSAGPANAHVSAMGRVAGFIAGLQVWLANPLLGTGPASFILASGLGFQAHNMVGQLAGELGTAGLLAFAGISLCCFWNLRRSRRLLRSRPELKDSLAYRTLLATVLMLVVQLIYGATSHNLYRFQWYWTAGFNVAAYACLQKRLLQQTARRTRPGQPALGCYQDHALRYARARAARRGLRLRQV